MYFRSSALILAVSLSACASPNPAVPPSAVSEQGAHRAANAPRAIRNLIVVVQEDRTFNDLFAGFPSADTSFYGKAHTGNAIRLRSYRLAGKPCSIDGGPLWVYSTVSDGGKWDGWDLLDKSDPDCPYTYVQRGDVQAYWTLAKGSTLDDETFAPTHFGDFVDRQYLIAGSTKIAANTYVAGFPNMIGGCNAPLNAATPILKNGEYNPIGPFPCFAYKTVATLLDTHGVTWRWYAENDSSENPFQYIKYVRAGPDWQRDISTPETNVFSDLKNGALAAVSWVTPRFKKSDHPGSRGAGGPEWVASLVSAVRNSRYWDHAAVVVLWDDGAGGQFYDPAAPAQLDILGLGLRVPLMVISPYAKTGVSHVQLETAGSTLRFIEDNWGLPRLGPDTTDNRANSIGELLHY